MMISIEPFAQKHVEDAARLFIAAYESQRADIGCLPPRYAEIGTITRLLEGVLETHPGVVAISDSRLVGYLTGFAGIPDFKGVSPGVYIPEWAHALEDGFGRGRVFQAMYDEMARRWVDQGYFTQAITFFASDTALRDLLYWSGFGLLVVDALRGLDQDDLDRGGGLEAGIAVRRANESDVGELARLDNALVTYLSRSPTFLFAEGDEEPEMAESFLGEGVISVVAERDGRLLACMRGTSRKENACRVVRDGSVMGIDFAYTDPSVRGVGIGARILGEILAWGRSRQKVGCAVDFESANVLGRRFWLEHFSPVCLSAIRYVDPRVGGTQQGS